MKIGYGGYQRSQPEGRTDPWPAIVPGRRDRRGEGGDIQLAIAPESMAEKRLSDT